MSKHLIHRQVLNLKYQDTTQAKADMPRWTEMFEKLILPAMSEVLDELEIPHQTIRIAQISLDLGKVNPGLDADTLVKKVKEVLRNEILKSIPELASTAAWGKRGTIDLPGISGVKDELRDLELLIFILDHGRNPWWKPDAKKSGIRDLLRRQLKEKNPSLKTWLETRSLSDLQIERLQNHCAYADLLDLGRWIFTQKTEKLAQLIESLEEALPKSLTSKSVWKSYKSIAILGFLFSEKTQKSNSLSRWAEEFLPKIQGSKISIPELSEPIFRALSDMQDTVFSESLLLEIWTKWTQTAFFKAHTSTVLLINDNNSTTHFRNFADRFSFQSTNTTSKNVARTFVSKSKSIPKNQANADLILEETYPITNAGLVLTAPFLPYLFRGLGLVEDKSFLSPEAQNRAALLIQALLDSTGKFEETDLLLNKILCGILPGEVIPVEIELSELEKEEIPNLLDAMVTQWTALKSTSGRSMAQGFFPREGSLKKIDRGYQLKIPRMSIDILLNRLPWTISIIKLPWMQETLFVEW